MMRANVTAPPPAPEYEDVAAIAGASSLEDDIEYDMGPVIAVDEDSELFYDMGELETVAYNATLEDNAEVVTLAPTGTRRPLQDPSTL
jgi:hypothetical protein